MLPIRLMILPYLQHWDGTTLRLRLITAPQNDPLAPLAPGEPPFVAADFQFEVRLVAGAGAVPTFGTPFIALDVPVPAPPRAQALCEALKAHLPINAGSGPVDARSSSVRFMKYAPPGYRDATGYRGGDNPFLVTDESYHCALKEPVPPGTVLKSDPPELSWGRVLAQALRQPLLAEDIGLVRALSIEPGPADVFKDGGWVYVTLQAGSAGASLLGIPGAIKQYAARVPPLTAARGLFTPVLFPVGTVVPPGVDYDELFREATAYDDGFAKAVYVRQPPQADPLAEGDGDRPVEDHGIQLGWDDEQLVTWLNRQVDPANAAQDAPMGVLGYRIDARKPGDAQWHSLVLGETAVKVGAFTLGPRAAEFQVEVAPNKLFGDGGPNYWLPSYYTAWTGPSLAAHDPVAAQLRGLDPNGAPVRGVEPDVTLRYGKQYEFRVRFADHTSGGPEAGDDAQNPAPQPSAPLRFLRWVQPGMIRLAQKPPVVEIADLPPASLEVRRPLLGYPAFVFAGGNVAELLADMPTANAQQRAPGRPDPDVSLLEIAVQVQTPGASATEGYLTLYTTTRPFPAGADDPFELDFTWTDIADARTLPVNAAGPIALPTSRRVRLQLTALCADRANYFGAPDVQRGPSYAVTLRRNADDERGLLHPGSAAELEGLFLQPAPPSMPAVFVAEKVAGLGVTAPQDPMGLLAATLDLDLEDLTLRARPGRHTMFGCSALLHHVIGPDSASVTFASLGEITRVWLVAVQLDVMRDWSWDGLDHLAVIRDGVEVGTVEPRGLGGQEAVGNAGRDRSQIVFIDAIDPKPAPGTFPRPLTATYRLTPVFRRAPLQRDPAAEVAITLPATTPPTQVPKLTSAGIAMSAYRRDALYTSTEERRKMLWLEFAAPPDDAKDLLFARVLAYDADPVLALESDPPAEKLEPPLPIDPEPIRSIVPGQGDDQAGLTAMQPLIPTDSPVHFLVPLPPGLTPDSPELFGFFTYEFRVGHAGFWTTAQGRFGRPLRVTGVQHTAPQLRCAVTRTKSRLEVSASFANPVRDGRSVRPFIPATGLWALLYAQVYQADAADRRNILLDARMLRPQRPSSSGAAIPTDTATAVWGEAQIASTLAQLTLGPDTPLSCLAIETLPGDRPWNDPVGAQLGYERFLRTSTLVHVPGLC
jgi:hypothetical protein